MSRSSSSNNPPNQARSWLQTHYEMKRERTVMLVRKAIDSLRKEGSSITIETVCQRSQLLDPQKRGIGKAGILGNAEAYAYYQQYRTSRPRRQGPATGRSHQKATTAYRLPTNLNRDLKQVRRRYLREQKSDLVERLLYVEQAYVESQQQLAHLQFKLIKMQIAREHDISHIKFHLSQE
jgi:ribosomal protein S21